MFKFHIQCKVFWQEDLTLYNTFLISANTFIQIYEIIIISIIQVYAHFRYFEKKMEKNILENLMKLIYI